MCLPVRCCFAVTQTEFTADLREFGLHPPHCATSQGIPTSCMSKTGAWEISPPLVSAKLQRQVVKLCLCNGVHSVTCLHSIYRDISFSSIRSEISQHSASITLSGTEQTGLCIRFLAASCLTVLASCMSCLCSLALLSLLCRSLQFALQLRVEKCIARRNGSCRPFYVISPALSLHHV